MLQRTLRWIIEFRAEARRQAEEKKFEADFAAFRAPSQRLVAGYFEHLRKIQRNPSKYGPLAALDFVPEAEPATSDKGKMGRPHKLRHW